MIDSRIRPVPVIVVGPHDLATTSMVSALRTAGFAAEGADLLVPRPTGAMPRKASGCGPDDRAGAGAGRRRA